MRPGTVSKDPDVQHILTAARDLLAVINRELAEPSDASSQEAEAETAPANSCDVLYVEDDPVNFMLVERILEKPEIERWLDGRIRRLEAELAGGAGQVEHRLEGEAHRRQPITTAVDARRRE